MNNPRGPFFGLRACLSIGTWVLSATATPGVGHAMLQRDVLNGKAAIQKRCLPGFKSVASCSCSDRGIMLQCEKCTLAKHCPPGAGSVTSDYTGTECICGTATTTTAATTTTTAAVSTTEPLVQWPECPQAPPHAVTLVIDVSGSMRRANRVGMIRDILPHLLHHFLRPKDAVAIITFSRSHRLVLNMTAVTKVDDEIEQDIRNALRASGSTAIYDTLIEAADISKLAPPGYGRIIIIVSDGVDTASKNKFPAALAKLGKWPNPKVLSIGLALDRTAGSIQKKLARATNGVYVNAKDDIEDVKEKFIAVADTLCKL